ncbi:hypothetical protein EN45_088020 [Penicillium chrysogenum]|uniref:Uncharacterized protein n=1 Tax=Penicillium chrysogenum TaxID=5076 RepID=A0A167QEG4_PENCH|nr:hypothetical protein EN45_088020 [Penicillium chrysogenum]
MAPPIRFALRVRPNLDPAEDLLSDESNVWIAEMPAEELSEAKALPVRLIRTVHRVSSLDAVTLAKLGVYTSAKHAQLYTQSSEAFSMHTDEAGAYPKRMEVAGGGATLFENEKVCIIGDHPDTFGRAAANLGLDVYGLDPKNEMQTDIPPWPHSDYRTYPYTTPVINVDAMHEGYAFVSMYAD